MHTHMHAHTHTHAYTHTHTDMSPQLGDTFGINDEYGAYSNTFHPVVPPKKQEPLSVQHNTTVTARYIPRINNEFRNLSALREID